jgi:DNA-binding transcriptional ArsR family regulator
VGMKAYFRAMNTPVRGEQHTTHSHITQKLIMVRIAFSAREIATGDVPAGQTPEDFTRSDLEAMGISPRSLDSHLSALSDLELITTVRRRRVTGRGSLPSVAHRQGQAHPAH